MTAVGVAWPASTADLQLSGKDRDAPPLAGARTFD